MEKFNNTKSVKCTSYKIVRSTIEQGKPAVYWLHQRVYKWKQQITCVPRKSICWNVSSCRYFHLCGKENKVIIL